LFSVADGDWRASNEDRDSESLVNLTATEADEIAPDSLRVRFASTEIESVDWPRAVSSHGRRQNDASRREKREALEFDAPLARRRLD
jgi:hypothetical protein